jgi:asparagine synthase (glutamine-hydrolysing)
MCGITGLWQLNPNQPVSPALIRQMTAVQRHRGPDDEGYLFADTANNCVVVCGGGDTAPELRLPEVAQLNNESGNLAFGFRRLAIIDVSAAGHQPMGSGDGALWLVFNGEIYNYVELRAELQAKGHSFTTATDTEVILHAYAEWGVECLQQFNGMFALALWDGRQRRLFCARDRFGIKPFHYVWNGEMFAFASEIKALLQLPNFDPRPNDAVVYEYLLSGGVERSDDTFFANIKQLPPGHYLMLAEGQLQINTYWDIDLSRRVDLAGDETGYTQKFYDLFEDAVRLHLRSDVPIGTCLSGGLDSSSIVMVANKLLFGDGLTRPEIVGRQQKTFSSCFTDARFDERQFIQPVLTATNAEANTIFPDAEQLIEDLPRLIWHQDEPFRSTSIFAQWSVMKAVAARGVKVLLDGQGSDEILAGYHPCFDYYWGMLARQGHWAILRQELSAYHALFGAAKAYPALRLLRPFAPAFAQRLGRRLKQGGILGMNNDFARVYRGQAHEFVYRGRDPFHQYLYAQTRYALPRLLRFEDRNSMAHSIEARVPFLDYRLVEFVFSLPANQKINRGLTKAILRNALKGVLPDEVRLRTDKMGFVTPEAVWLAEDLRAWINDIIHTDSFRSRPYFNAPQIIRAFEEYWAGRRDISQIAWRWLNLELWLRQMVDQRPSIQALTS